MDGCLLPGGTSNRQGQAWLIGSVRKNLNMSTHEVSNSDDDVQPLPYKHSCRPYHDAVYVFDLKIAQSKIFAIFAICQPGSHATILCNTMREESLMKVVKIYGDFFLSDSLTLSTSSEPIANSRSKLRVTDLATWTNTLPASSIDPRIQGEPEYLQKDTRERKQ